MHKPTHRCIRCGKADLDARDLEINPYNGKIWGCPKCGGKELESLELAPEVFEGACDGFTFATQVGLQVKGLGFGSNQGKWALPDKPFSDMYGWSWTLKYENSKWYWRVEQGKNCLIYPCPDLPSPLPPIYEAAQ